MRKEWVAKFVDGDGNCSWRSLAMAIWGSDKYWVQLKLVVLAWCLANTESLFEQGRILFEKGTFYPGTIYKKYGQHRSGDDVSSSFNHFQMLIASVEHFSGPAVWGTDLTLMMAAQALRITVKLLSPVDKKSRLEFNEQLAQQARGTGRKGDGFSDNRYSQVFMPDDAALVYRGVGEGGNARVIEEAAVALTGGYSRAHADELADIPEIESDFIHTRGSHFAAVMSTGARNCPFPLFKVAPPLHKQLVRFGAVDSQAPPRFKSYKFYSPINLRHACDACVVLYLCLIVQDEHFSTQCEEEQAAYNQTQGIQPGSEEEAAVVAAETRRKVRMQSARANKQQALDALLKARQGERDREEEEKEEKRRKQKEAEQKIAARAERARALLAAKEEEEEEDKRRREKEDGGGGAKPKGNDEEDRGAGEGRGGEEKAAGAGGASGQGEEASGAGDGGATTEVLEQRRGLSLLQRTKFAV